MTICLDCFLYEFGSSFVFVLGWALSLAIFARVVLSWIQVPLPMGAQRFLFEITEPLLAPIRRMLPGGIMLDFSPFIALLLIGLVRDALLSILAQLR